MSSDAVRAPRDEAKSAKQNFWLQTVLLLPFLAIFGFTALNIGTGVVFLVLVAIRLAFPYNETLRKGELWLAVIMTAVWIMVTYD